jgi:hypothetical protein
MSLSCWSAVTPSSRPTSSTIFPSAIRSTVVPVKYIFRPVAAGNDPTRKSLKALPTTDDIIAFRDQVRGALEREIGECLAEPDHERLDVGMAAPRLMQRILQKHVWSSKFIDDAEIACLAPEICEPAANDGLVVVCLTHLISSDRFRR